jgi:hypothetical protein
MKIFLGARQARGFTRVRVLLLRARSFFRALRGDVLGSGQPRCRHACRAGGWIGDRDTNLHAQSKSSQPLRHRPVGPLTQS